MQSIIRHLYSDTKVGRETENIDGIMQSLLFFNRTFISFLEILVNVGFLLQSDISKDKFTELLKRWIENKGLDAIRNVPEPVRNYHAITIEHWAFKFS